MGKAHADEIGMAMTYDEAKAQILHEVRKGGGDPSKVSPQALDECIQQLLDTQRSPTWAKLKWLPLTIAKTIYVKFVRGLTWIINFASGH